MKYSLDNSTELINALQSGNNDAFKFIFEVLYDDLVRYIFSLCNDRDKAEDIVQGTFVKIWEQRQSLTINSSVKSYLFRSCHNKFINSLREHRNTVSLSDNMYLENFLEDETGKKEAHRNYEILQKAIDDLPPKCKEVFTLHKFNGLKYREIAEKLNISIKTVENQVSKAYQKLREAFTDDKI
ncbi:RNA polymerase sigma factor [Sinomicrobium sp. M5D2P17]